VHDLIELVSIPHAPVDYQKFIMGQTERASQHRPERGWEPFFLRISDFGFWPSALIHQPATLALAGARLHAF